MTDRTEDHARPEPQECTGLPGAPAISTESTAIEDDNDYLPLPTFICRGIGWAREERERRAAASRWSRLRKWLRQTFSR